MMRRCQKDLMTRIIGIAKMTRIPMMRMTTLKMAVMLFLLMTVCDLIIHESI